MNKFFSMLMASALIISIANCGSGNNMINKEWKEKNGKATDWTKQQALVLPIDIHAEGGSDAFRVALSGALMGGIIGATGGKWVSIQPAIAIPPFNQNLSHEITWNVYHMADFHKTWDPNKDIHGSSPQPVVKLIQALPGAVTLAVQKVEAQLKKPIGFAPRFLVVAHIDAGPTKMIAGKGIKSLAVRATIYDSQTSQYISYTEFNTSYPVSGNAKTDDAMAIGKMATVGGEIFANLIKPLM